MGLESVQPSVPGQVVKPAKDGRDDRQPDDREADGRKRRRNEGGQAEPQPVINSRGEVTGRTVNTTA